MKCLPLNDAQVEKSSFHGRCSVEPKVTVARVRLQPRVALIALVAWQH